MTVVNNSNYNYITVEEVCQKINSQLKSIFLVSPRKYLKKMEAKVFSNILDIASCDEKIVDFFCFCDKVHELAGCQKPDWDVFVCTLDNYLKDSTKTVKGAL